MSQEYIIPVNTTYRENMYIYMHFWITDSQIVPRVNFLTL